MNCGTCGAWSFVKETRSADRGFSTKRTRECANGHRFVSFEVLEPIYRHSLPRVREATNAAEARAFRRKRDAAIAKACETREQAEVGQEFNLSQASVSRIVLAARACSQATPNV